MAMKYPDITNSRISRLKNMGFLHTQTLAHSVEFRTKSGEYFYLQMTKKCSTVFDPRKWRRGHEILQSIGEERFNSNFVEFPAKMHGGKAPERYGIGFDATSDAHMSQIIQAAFGV